MDRLQARVRDEVYRYFLDLQRAPLPAELATILDTRQLDIEQALEGLARRHAIVLIPASHYIWMANPFSGVATDFKVRAANKEWFANCIWDALGVVTLVGGDGTIQTHCPDCSASMEVRVKRSDVEADDADACVHFLVPAAKWWDSIGHT